MEYQSPDPYIEKKGAFYQCILCASHLNSVAQVQSHISGSSHQSRLNPVLHQAENVHSAEQKFSAFNLTAESNLPQYVEKHGFGYRCVCCEIPLNGNIQIASHVAGAKHIKRATSFSVSRGETKMEVEHMGQPTNDHKNSKIVSFVHNPVNSSPASNSNLPPHIERFGDQYRCGCCDSMLNSYSQINSHVSGAKHIKAKLFHDANPALSLVKSDCENVRGTENMEESYDLYSELKEIIPEELMKNIKIIKAADDIIF